MIDVEIRPARIEDAEIVSAVLMASISRLCAPDHHNDPAAIDRWLANKSPDQIKNMISTGGFYVADMKGSLIAVGAVDAVDKLEHSGRITLNYVDPVFRFRGVSRLLMAALENALVQDGAQVGLLTSTRTARQFYLSGGWVQTEKERNGRWIVGYPMSKLLTPV